MPSLQCLLQFLWSCLSHFVFEGKSMPNKTALLYPGQIHLRLECLCFLSCFYFLFCFSSLPDRYLPIWRSKTFSLFCSPCYWFWLMGIGVGVGKERQSLYLTTKIIPSPWHVQQLQREFDVWGDRGARVILIYLSIGTERIGSSKGTAEVRMSQGFRGGNILQAKKKKLFINTSERTERKTPEPASLNTWPCLKEDWTAFERDAWHGWGHDGGPSSLTTLQPRSALLKLSEPTDQLWSQQNCRFQFRRSRVGLKILHFYQVSKWGWGGCSLDHPWRRKTLLKHCGRAQAKKKQGRGLDSHLLLSPVYLQPSLCPKPHCVFTSPLLPTCPSLFCPRSPWRWGTEVCWSLHIGLCSEKELHKYCSCAEKCPSSSMKLCQAISAL